MDYQLSIKGSVMEMAEAMKVLAELDVRLKAEAKADLNPVTKRPAGNVDQHVPTKKAPVELVDKKSAVKNPLVVEEELVGQVSITDVPNPVPDQVEIVVPVVVEKANYITKDSVRALATQLVRANKSKEVNAAIVSVGAASISKVADDKLEELHALLAAL